MMKYLLYPPFLTVPEENGFENEWEAFCLKLLKLEKKNNDIERRTPPEQGVDLHFKEKGIAYQCKSVVGNSSGFNITKAVKSLESALGIQKTLLWEEYVVCSNVNLTGSQITKLMKVYSNVDTKGHDYWVGLCEKYSQQVKRNFRVLLEIPSDIIQSTFNSLEEHYLEKLKIKMEKDTLDIFFYYQEHDKVYQMKVSLDFTIKELKSIIRSFLDIPEALIGQNGLLYVSEFLIIEDKKQEEDKTLRDIGIIPNSVFTYWLSYSFVGRSGTKRTNNAMQWLTGSSFDSVNEKETYLELAKSHIKQCFNTFDDSLK
ncbi:hypothetical protein IC7_00573 [Bacillus cereus BAG1O-1]|nr:hypothetical protein IC7_00573 [Bacillus cereus BAG1O-1]